MPITTSKLITDAQKTYRLERFDIEISLAHIVQEPREWIISHPDFFVPWRKIFRFQRLLAKRAKGIPLAYLTGHKEFYRLDFLVNKHTLVPRPDTEVLVEEAVREIQKLRNKEIKENTKQSLIVIDVGTGTGCIPISIMTTLQHSNSSAITPFATDISKPALRVAKKNAAIHNVNITFLGGNLLEPFLKKYCSLFADHCSLIVTANLPYLTEEQFQTEPSIQHEPKTALVASDRGLGLYKELLMQIKKLFTVHRVPVTTFFEIDPSQTKILSEEIKGVFPLATVEVIKDLSGNDRVLKTSL